MGFPEEAHSYFGYVSIHLRDRSGLPDGDDAVFGTFRADPCQRGAPGESSIRP